MRIISSQLRWVTAAHHHHKTHHTVSEKKWGSFVHMCYKSVEISLNVTFAELHVDQRRKCRTLLCKRGRGQVFWRQTDIYTGRLWQQGLEDRKEHIASIIWNLHSCLFHIQNTGCLFYRHFIGQTHHTLLQHAGRINKDNPKWHACAYVSRQSHVWQTRTQKFEEVNSDVFDPSY